MLKIKNKDSKAMTSFCSRVDGDSVPSKQFPAQSQQYYNITCAIYAKLTKF